MRGAGSAPGQGKRRPSPALVVAIVALVVALGGTSYAAINLPKNSVGAKQLKKNAVTAKKIRKNAVTARKIRKNAVSSAKVKNRSLLAKDFRKGQLPRGATGATGPAGPIAGTPAGGALSGTYPNPGIANEAVGPDQLTPAPGARAISNVPATTPNATNIVFSLNATGFNQGNLYSNDADAMVIAVPGTYVITGMVGWQGNSAGQRQTRILINGSIRVSQSGSPGNAGTIRQTVATIEQLKAGDEVQLGGYQTSGGDLDTVVGTGQGAVHLTAAWVGP